MTPFPFCWSMQPYEDEVFWCKCKRCKRALRDLGYHCYVRKMIAENPTWRGQ